MKNKIIIYSDGACLNNGAKNSVGGWSVIIDNGSKQLRRSGQVMNTTSNRMELTAILEGLKALRKDGLDVLVFTDSTYARNGCSSWIENWKENNWKNSKKKPVENQDLWQEIDKQLQRLNVTFAYVKSHSGNPMNELADTLAKKACYGETVNQYKKSVLAKKMQ